MSLVEKALGKLRSGQVLVESRATNEALENKHSSTSIWSSEAPAPRRTVSLDRQALQREGMLPPLDQSRRMLNEYRSIKRPLMAKAFGGEGDAIKIGNLVMVTSSLPGEGKSFTSFNLAVSIGREKDKQVLLVDGDVVNPSLSRTMGLANEPGLLDAIKDSSLDINDLVLGTDIPGLCVLPAGRPDESSAELMSSARVQELFAELASSYGRRMVIVDSSPLLLTNEAHSLSELVGQVVMVVAAGQTTSAVLSRALERLSTAAHVTMVLNRHSGSDEAAYYGEYGAEAYRGKV